MKNLNKRLDEIDDFIHQPTEKRVEPPSEIEFRNYHLQSGNRVKMNYLLFLFANAFLKRNGKNVSINFDYIDFLNIFEEGKIRGHYHVSVNDFVEKSYAYAHNLNPELLKVAESVNADPATLSYYSISDYRNMVCAYLHDAGVFKVGPIEFLAKHGLATLDEIE